MPHLFPNTFDCSSCAQAKQMTESLVLYSLASKTWSPCNCSLTSSEANSFRYRSFRLHLPVIYHDRI
ncbi:hypothetical protein EUGRSUZ_I00142 [Eucalyptus grandis]|uniref:Uncharacterized protein n=2 Tax=Eucalyptus grandis TaxID=71139 RepID=A0ACC3JBA6_EUCGR|nr:hypothetical protein EUGRSUZ_I00142 [Eucalyptus grandis]